MLTSLINHDWEIINQIVLVVISLLYFGYTVALGKNGMEIIRKLRNHWMWNTNRTWREHGILLGVATTYPILGFILGLVF